MCSDGFVCEVIQRANKKKRRGHETRPSWPSKSRVPFGRGPLWRCMLHVLRVHKPGFHSTTHICIYSTSIMFHQRTKSKHGVLWHCRAPPRWGPHPPMRRWWWRTLWRWSLQANPAKPSFLTHSQPISPTMDLDIEVWLSHAWVCVNHPAWQPNTYQHSRIPDQYCQYQSPNPTLGVIFTLQVAQQDAILMKLDQSYFTELESKSILEAFPS